jgi:tetratricopeptide (TPR) repeat protein
MESLILCHPKHAVHPYDVTRIHRKIYTLEELCYYLCNNLYLVDYTIMNEQLCRWLEEELEMKELSDKLIDILRTKGSIEKFVLMILSDSHIYNEAEMIRIQNVLERLKNQKDIERQKYKGDNLLESGEWEEAILVYQSILNQEKDESVEDKFYGHIYANMGAAYGKLFLYQESARMYDRAFLICGDVSMLEPYLYASYKYMSMEEYHILLTKNETFIEVNAKMRQRCSDVRAGIEDSFTKKDLEDWKYQYRRSHV